MRQLIVAGNWKMNKNLTEGIALTKAIAKGDRPDNVLVILGVPAIHLSAACETVQTAENMEIAAQNCHQATSGAYTGEISADMIQSTGAQYVIIGHSERRAYFGEDDTLIAQKVKLAIETGLKPIYCCGEKLPTREAGNHVALVASQIEDGLFHLGAEEFKKVVIAYEPVWAIGTGVTASPEQAQEMHKNIRSMVEGKYGSDIADSTTILYGGSVKPKNAQELFTQPDVDGGLVGGASLEADDFLAIINSYV